MPPRERRGEYTPPNRSPFVGLVPPRSARPARPPPVVVEYSSARRRPGWPCLAPVLGIPASAGDFGRRPCRRKAKPSDPIRLVRSRAGYGLRPPRGAATAARLLRSLVAARGRSPLAKKNNRPFNRGLRPLVASRPAAARRGLRPLKKPQAAAAAQPSGRSPTLHYRGCFAAAVKGEQVSPQKSRCCCCPAGGKDFFCCALDRRSKTMRRPAMESRGEKMRHRSGGLTAANQRDPARRQQENQRERTNKNTKANQRRQQRNEKTKSRTSGRCQQKASGR